ncbi:hypothetical protein ROZALSC1DRAFT_29722 [Rozella allomycis CSF55]|uniref:FMR1-interacting protein 1 conserved domain-containing protein n=1 Tax=Rozella allomycis (strain CSF55) TaxID=988480 RepID=A0A075B4Q3_ROZAC|nr:hypothetical protein O9G_004505 [Rozella allomycis CSF55]RKP18611.1 hypothetical protein ROZALSC1DRAFT_29722 [Rozella allomycis CSF55]|eukprot:EPZ36379.1 hypothetical protein O9G_004505 [Rozella allomycis CSF55]
MSNPWIHSSFNKNTKNFAAIFKVTKAHQFNFHQDELSHISRTANLNNKTESEEDVQKYILERKRKYPCEANRLRNEIEKIESSDPLCLISENYESEEDKTTLETKKKPKRDRRKGNGKPLKIPIGLALLEKEVEEKHVYILEAFNFLFK